LARPFFRRLKNPVGSDDLDISFSDPITFGRERVILSSLSSFRLNQPIAAILTGGRFKIY